MRRWQAKIVTFYHKFHQTDKWEPEEPTTLDWGLCAGASEGEEEGWNKEDAEIPTNPELLAEGRGELLGNGMKELDNEMLLDNEFVKEIVTLWLPETPGDVEAEMTGLEGAVVAEIDLVAVLVRLREGEIELEKEWDEVREGEMLSLPETPGELEKECVAVMELERECVREMELEWDMEFEELKEVEPLGEIIVLGEDEAREGDIEWEWEIELLLLGETGVDEEAARLLRIGELERECVREIEGDLEGVTAIEEVGLLAPGEEEALEGRIRGDGEEENKEASKGLASTTRWLR